MKFVMKISKFMLNCTGTGLRLSTLLADEVDKRVDKCAEMKDEMLAESMQVRDLCFDKVSELRATLESFADFSRNELQNFNEQFEKMGKRLDVSTKTFSYVFKVHDNIL